MKGQLHIHTTASDGKLTPQEAADRYAGLGFDFIAFTDHDHLLKPNYHKLIATVKTNLLVFDGIELTVCTRWGYVHVSQISGDKEELYIFNHPADYGLSIKEVLQCIDDVLQKYPVDAVEITHMGFSTPEFNSDLIPYPKVATDDSHNSLACGRAWIEVDGKRDKDSILSKIKQGRFKCGYTKGDTRSIKIV